MKHILENAIALYDDGGTSAMWTYLNRLIRSGIIDDGAAEQVAYMAEREA